MSPMENTRQTALFQPRLQARKETEDTANFRERQRRNRLRDETQMRAVGKDGLQTKLLALKAYLDELEHWRTNPAEPVGPRALLRITERLLQVIVECAADAGNLWLAKHGHPNGDSIRDVFRQLQEAGMLSAEVEQRFEGYVETRDRIVHDYNPLDPAGLAAQAPELLA